MVKATKATKKFQQKHLGRELKKRKVDQKKRQQREKSLSKYAPKEGEEERVSGDEEEEQEEIGVRRSEADIFATKSKSAPPRAARAAAAPAAAAKATARKAPPIEDMDVDEFMDGSFLDDDANERLDDSAIDAEDDDEEEEEEEEGEDAEMGSEEEGDEDDEAALLADIERHEAELANLAEADPEFFKHLQENDQELLSFSKQRELEEDDEEDQDAALDDEEAGQEQEVLTWASLQSLKKSIMAPSLSIRGLKKFVRIFRSAVRIGSVAKPRAKGEDEAAHAKREAREAAFRKEVAIHDSRVFQELVRFAINDVTAVWATHFASPGAKPVKKEKGAAAPAPTPAAASLEKHAKWNSVGPILKAFLSHLLFFLSTLRSSGDEEASSNAKMARFVLGGMEGLVRFFEPFPRLAQKLLKELLELWATSDRNVRIDAFLRIRQMAIELSSAGPRAGDNMLEMALKGIYLTYVRHSKFTSALTLPVIDFMANCVVELYGLDPSLSYQHAFVYLRQLAIHLRGALTNKKKEAHRAVYNWNFINSLRCWGKVLAAHGKASPSSVGQNGALAASDNLQALVYPYVQICLGTLTVLPSTRYLPLRFHVCRFVIDLCGSVKVFVPLAPHLLGVFQAPELRRKPTSSTRKQAELAHVLKASRLITSTKLFQENAVAEALHLLLEYFAQFAYSVSFPELVLPTIKLMRRSAKDMLISRVRKQLQGFVLKLEHNASWIVAKRNGTEWAPRDVLAPKGPDAIETFKGDVGKKGQNQAPLEKYVQLQMQEKKAMDDTRADWDGSMGSRNEPKRKKKGQDSDDEEDEEDLRHQRRRGRDQEEDDDEDEGEDDEDMEDGEEDNDGGEVEDEDDEDAPPSKKSKTSASAAAPRKPFQMPDDEELESGDEGDVLEEFAFSDDEDAKPKQKKGKAKQQKQKQKAKPVKQEAKANGKPVDKKRKRN